MKKILLTVGATVVVIGGGLAAVNHYNEYQNKKEAAKVVVTEQAVANAKEEQRKEDLAKINLLSKANQKLQEGCNNGEHAYAKLTPYSKTLVSEPDCNTTTN